MTKDAQAFWDAAFLIAFKKRVDDGFTAEVAALQAAMYADSALKYRQTAGGNG